MKLSRNNKSLEPVQWPWVFSHVIAHSFAIYGLQYFSWINLAYMLAVHYFIILFGITLGYHRLYSHRSYNTSTTVEFILGFIGVLAVQGGPAFWASVHRAHHAFTDSHGDAHSAKRGFWWAHQGWLMRRMPNGFSMISSRRKIIDITNSRYSLLLEKNFLWINLITAVGAFLILPQHIWFWVFPVRIVFTWHVTWTVNSFAHGLFPFRNSQSPSPKNITWISILTGGEGLHFNHHKDPNSPSFEHRKGEFDLGYRILKIMSRLGLVSLRGIKQRAY